MNASERIETRISDGELERRWGAVRLGMFEHKIDVLVLQSQNDWLGGYIKWFTDIPANNGYPRTVAFHIDAPMTVIDMGPFDVRREFGPRETLHRGVERMLSVPAFTSIEYTRAYHADLLAPELVRHRRIGLVAEGGMTHGLVAALRAALPRTEFVDGTELVDEIKAIKSDEEIDLIRRVAALQDAAFAAVLAEIRPGLRDSEIASIAWAKAQELGSEQGITLGCSAPLGERASFIGRHMQGRKIEAGDHFSLLIEVNGPGGFYTELARTVVLGRASPELLDGFAAMSEAQSHTLSLMRPGASCSKIAAAHDEWMTARGLPNEKRLYSHGQGADMVERPLIRHDETMTLKSGMNLAVHPGYETDRLFAVICDNYIVEEGGPSVCLHRTEKRVFELD